MTSDRRQVVQDSTQYLLATILGQAVGVLRLFLLPGLVTPAELGLWSLMNVVVGYGANIHLGALPGMNKAISVRRGRGETEPIDRLKSTVFWFNAALGAIAVVVLYTASFFAAPLYAQGLRVTAVIVFLQLLYLFYFSAIRADAYFGILSRGSLIQSVLATLLVLAFAFAWPNHLVGALAGLAASYIVALVYWGIKYDFRFRIRFDRSLLKESFGLGAPLIVLGILDTIFLSMDRWIISGRLSETTLGYYALGFMLSNLALMIPIPIGTVLYPRMLERFAATGSADALRNLVLPPLRAIGSLMIVLIAGAAVLVGPLIRLLLPKYVDAVLLCEIQILGAYLLCIAPIATNALISINLQNWLVTARVIAIVLTLGMDLFAIRYGAAGIAVATMIGYAIIGLLSIVPALYHCGGGRAGVLGTLPRLLLPYLGMLAVFLATRGLVGEGSAPAMLSMAALRLAIVFAVTAVLVWASHNDGELATFTRGEWKHLLARRAH